MSEKVIVKVLGNDIEVEKGTTIFELSKKYQDGFKSTIVLVLVNNTLKELNHKLEENCEITFLDLTSKDGYKAYQRCLAFLMIKVFKDLFNEEAIDVVVHFSINQGYYCEIKDKKIPITEQVLDQVKERMNDIIQRDVPIEKVTLKTDKAREIFKKQRMKDKLDLFTYRRSAYVNMSRIEEYYDYFYGQMVPSTGCLKLFNLYPFEDGWVLQFMEQKETSCVAKFNPDKKLFKALKRNTNWDELMEVENVGDLNKVISSGQINELMLVSEALMEKRIARIADRIIEDTNGKKFVFIAGPSSSGKTTFAYRLSIQLRAHGVRPHVISLDNYFVNRELTPRDEYGNFDFECLEALDIKQFNEDMEQLLSGKTVDMPVFNFIKGEREYKGNFLNLEGNGVLIIEGIHGLNDKLSYSIPDAKKYKIYISALTTLNVDNHNYISTTDARLIRRMVRDYQFRGASAIRTIGMWDSVRRGEERHIFPFQEQADTMFNSSLSYELSLLKQYAEPLLFNVTSDCAEYKEARRLIKFLDYFLGISSEKVPYNSILREFIGGSCF